jgi:GNAT superfamily N-acetyltransferase
MQEISPGTTDAPVIAALTEAQLPDATRIFRTAFGTWLGAPDPENFFADRDYVRGRWQSPHVAALGASIDGRLVGSNFVTRWGSVGFFGPLTVEPALQDRGIARALLAATVTQFETWGTRCAGLFTFAESPKHVALYQKFGFMPRFLTVVSVAAVPASAHATCLRFGGLTTAEKSESLQATRAITESLYPGLDLSAEIETASTLGLGDTVLLEDDGGLAGFAVCHFGPQSEAGTDTCLIKFAAVRHDTHAAANHHRLLDVCFAYAAEVGAKTLMAGVNTARREAHATMLARGFQPALHGIAIHRPDDPGYSRPGVFVLDDWR